MSTGEAQFILKTHVSIYIYLSFNKLFFYQEFVNNEFLINSPIKSRSDLNDLKQGYIKKND